VQPRVTGYLIDDRFRDRPRPNQDRRIGALGGVALFKGLSRRNLTRIDRIAFLKFAQEGDVLLKQGDPGDVMMVVLDGCASVSRGKRKLGECTPGQCFGEMALLDNQPRSASVVALDSMRLVVVPGAEFRKLLPKVPHLAEALLSTLSTRLREANAAADF
jgi:CRP/FNR family cyclic AMP-dependent transcriptional regulator